MAAAAAAVGAVVNDPRQTLAFLRGVLAAGAADEEYVLFGSAVLWLHGIRDRVGDVDVFVSPRLWGEWFISHDWTLETPTPGDPPFLETERLHPPIHAFYAWTERDRGWITVGECFARAETFEGWRCIPLDLVRSIKLRAYEANPDSEAHAKHLTDVALIDHHLRVAGAR